MPKCCNRVCSRCLGSGKEPDPVAIGCAMKEMRLKSGLSLRKFARRAGLSPSCVSDLERGHRHWGTKASVKYLEALR